MNDCVSDSHVQTVEVSQTGAIISRSVYYYSYAGELIRVRHYGPRRGRWRAALLHFRLLARRAVLISLRRDV
jgi:hypothetical protein